LREPWVRASAGMQIAMHSTQGESIRSNERLVCAGQTQCVRRLSEAATLEVEGRRRSMVQGWRRFACATAASPSASVWLRRLEDQFKDKGTRSCLLPWRQLRSLRIGQAACEATSRGVRGRTRDGSMNEADGSSRSAMTFSEQRQRQ
jgi:hypothetical protein